MIWYVKMIVQTLQTGLLLSLELPVFETLIHLMSPNTKLLLYTITIRSFCNCSLFKQIHLNKINNRHKLIIRVSHWRQRRIKARRMRKPVLLSPSFPQLSLILCRTTILWRHRFSICSIRRFHRFSLWFIIACVFYSRTRSILTFAIFTSLVDVPFAAELDTANEKIAEFKNCYNGRAEPKAYSATEVRVKLDVLD